MTPDAVRSIDHFTKTHVAPRGPGSVPRFRAAVEHGYSEGTHSCCRLHLSLHALDTSMSRRVLRARVWERRTPGCFLFLLPRFQLISIRASSLAASPCSLPFILPLTVSVYVSLLNTSHFLHRHLSRLTTSCPSPPTLPTQAPTHPLLPYV